MLISCATAQDGKKELVADSLYHDQDSVLSHIEDYSDTIEIKYAKGLKVEYKPDGIHVTITNPDPAAKASKPQHITIRKSSSRFICTTALQLGNFEVLGLEDKIVGINSLRHIFSLRMLDQLESGKTAEIGKEGNFDLETVMRTKPDFILVSASKYGGFEALKECGIPLIFHHGYKETNPLGQAEWIKLVGILTGETKRANAVFADIEKKYNTLKEEVEKATSDNKKLPTVISGRQLRDGWVYRGRQKLYGTDIQGCRSRLHNEGQQRIGRSDARLRGCLRQGREGRLLADRRFVERQLHDAEPCRRRRALHHDERIQEQARHLLRPQSDTIQGTCRSAAAFPACRLREGFPSGTAAQLYAEVLSYPEIKNQDINQ